MGVHTSMKLLVTTSQSVLLVDAATGAGARLHRGAGLYYGIARVAGGFAVAARRRSVSSTVLQADEAGCILAFDRAFNLERSVEAPFALRDMHQIAWFDDRLWITCSYDDVVAVHYGAHWARWMPLPVPADAAPDRHHFNTFLVSRDEIALLAHNQGPSVAHFFDRRTRTLLRSVPLGVQAHDLWIENGALYTCSSIESRLVSTSGASHRTGGFPRGVAITAAARVVGLSALAERGMRDWSSAAIAVCDAAWKPAHYVHLVLEGMVLDVVALEDAEAAAIERAGHEALAFPLRERIGEADLLGT